MMQQYLGIKARYPDAFVFYRMGDFYELFLEDAERAAPLLDITLTTRDKDKNDPVPMCGVPVHSADGYIRRLAELGHRVAICEQVEDAKVAAGKPGKTLVRRDVVEVVTPGLVGDPSGLDGAQEVAVAAVAFGPSEAGLAALDASTGNFRATEQQREPGVIPAALLDELERIAPREILVAADLPEDAPEWLRIRARLPNAAITRVPGESFMASDAPIAPHGFDSDETGSAAAAAAAVLCYVAVQQPAALEHAPRLRRYGLGDTMILDASTRRHLELFENGEDRGRHLTLIERIDETRTPLGARRLAQWVAYPLCDPATIAARQDGVAWLTERDRPRGRLRDALGPVRDLERLYARCARPGAEPRDLASLRASLDALPSIGSALRSGDGELVDGDTAEVPGVLPLPEPIPEITDLLWQALVDEPKALPKGSRGANESGYIRPGFRTELDAIQEGAAKGREWIAGLEAEERERTGIANLKVRFHPVHGYSLEVSKSQLSKLPDEYERKQTLANVERYTTPALRDVEATVMGANERAASLEREIFDDVRQGVLARADDIRAAADAVGILDALHSLAEVARRDSWTRPVVDDSECLEIHGGRHPVVESMLRRSGSDEFVPNDTLLDPDGTRILLITGPNMAGKSTYLRQVAVLVLLAQIGSFVPAESARVGAVDRIFTRVGASDRLARGESTFMVEMRETAEILSQASSRSLVILDEIGRGTSTFDGLSIAWSVGEYLHDTPGLGPRTLFATHYHELADLARTRTGVANAHFEAREWGDDVVFLRRLVAGEASRSYGIQVARLAGLPEAVVVRARELLARLEAGEIEGGVPRLAGEPAPGNDDQLSLFTAAEPDPVVEDVLAQLRTLDPERTTPMEALELLARLRAKLDDGGAA
jgi:DNA mismatch repair protein MutS